MSGTDQYGRPKQTFQLSVVDTGVGISPEGLQALRSFQPFTQVDQSKRCLSACDLAAGRFLVLTLALLLYRYGGTGLGLVLCNRIVTTMGGVMEIESELGVGSVFTAYLDLEVLDVSISSLRSSWR